MGIILTRFRKKKTTLEVLESLETDIKHIEEYRVSTEQRHRTIVGHLILYSVGLYVLAAVLFYFYFFPASLSDQLFYITPLLIFPIIIVFLKRLVSWYYHRKISRNQEKLLDMCNQKKQLLEEVMDRETYKVAKQILEKFAPDQLRKTPSLAVAVRPGSEQSPLPSARSPIHPSPSLPPLLSSSSIIPPGAPALPVTGGDLRRRGPIPRPPALLPPGVQGRQSINGQGFGARLPPGPPPGPPMPRPVLPRERGILDKLVEYLVGDGSSNRYALVCRQCESHNGMALKEEFEYLSFRCCYCYYWNPARKQRPQAPRLGQISPVQTSASEIESASSTTEDDESEAESGLSSPVGKEEVEEAPRREPTPSTEDDINKKEVESEEPPRTEAEAPPKGEEEQQQPERKDSVPPTPPQTTDL